VSFRGMASRKRDIGREILEGIREIKLGEHGRVTTLPSVSASERRPVCRRLCLRDCSGFQFGRCKSGNRVGVPPLAQLALCCLLQQRILMRFWM
jgi:hypothetical protein